MNSLWRFAVWPACISARTRGALLQTIKWGTFVHFGAFADGDPKDRRRGKRGRSLILLGGRGGAADENLARGGV